MTLSYKSLEEEKLNRWSSIWHNLNSKTNVKMINRWKISQKKYQPPCYKELLLYHTTTFYNLSDSPPPPPTLMANKIYNTLKKEGPNLVCTILKTLNFFGLTNFTTVNLHAIWLMHLYVNLSPSNCSYTRQSGVSFPLIVSSMLGCSRLSVSYRVALLKNLLKEPF